MPRLNTDDLILHGSDADVQTLISQSPRLENDGAIALLSSRFLAKAYMPDFLDDTTKAMEVARTLGIRAPQTIRSIRGQHTDYLVMQRVEGTTLEDAWPRLGWYLSIRLALQLRRFVKLLRSHTSDRAGCLVTGKCRSFWLEDHFRLPARATVRQVMDFLAFWTGFRSIRQEFRKSLQDQAILRGSSDLDARTFVLTHHDLAPRNIMVDKSGDAWLVDWDLAGYYPIYFEYAAMSNFFVPDNWGFGGRLRWWVLEWLVAGRYHKQCKQLAVIRSKLQRFSVGRRLNIKAKVTASSLEKAPDSSDESDCATVLQD